MNPLGNILSQYGLDPEIARTVQATDSLTRAVDQWSTSQVGESAADQLANVIGAVIPPIFRVPPTSQGLQFEPAAGEWESSRYAQDLIAHQPKFKFLFKVSFRGFPGGAFDRYVTRCDRPKIAINHVDVNYYNFRSKVMTSLTFLPITMTFMDEIGDSVNYFAKEYLKEVSGQAGGYTGIDEGFGKASSTRPYLNAASLGREITIQQIFGNGLADNRFIFKNPRIEVIDFDELTMDDSIQGSSVTITFHYDGLEMITGNGTPIYNWGNTDIGAGGGTSNFANAGADTPLSNVISGAASIMAGRSPITVQRTADISGFGSVVSNLTDSVQSTMGTAGKMLSSATSVVDRGIQSTLSSIKSGFNLKYNGSTETTYNQDEA